MDDHPVVRHGLAQVINRESDMRICAEAGNIAEALSAMNRHKPDVVVIDITLQRDNGLELIKQIKANGGAARALVTSMHDEAVYAERSLRAGAMGYLNKSRSLEELVTAIRQVIRGKVYLSDTMTDRMMQQVIGRAETPNRPVSDRLSDRELEVFELLGKGLTTREIADSLHLSVKTIDTHREHIRKKLGLRNRIEIVRRAVLWVEQGG